VFEVVAIPEDAPSKIPQNDVEEKCPSKNGKTKDCLN